MSYRIKVSEDKLRKTSDRRLFSLVTEFGYIYIYISEDKLRKISDRRLFSLVTEYKFSNIRATISSRIQFYKFPKISC